MMVRFILVENHGIWTLDAIITNITFVIGNVMKNKRRHDDWMETGNEFRLCVVVVRNWNGEMSRQTLLDEQN